MLFETPPDYYDGHLHTVEADEKGDGISDESGEPPHTHEVFNGVVQPTQTEQYVSQHPGDLVPVDQGQRPQMAGTPAGQQLQPPQPNVPAQPPVPPGAYEDVLRSIESIVENGDIDSQVNRLIYEWG